jgi:B12-binding domain/radical SAM domain protein
MWPLGKADLVLLHPPSVYDFRRRVSLYGPISDVIPSTVIFEMYPIGFTSIAEYLESHGIRVRILNLAYRMLKDPLFQVEDAIRRLRPKAFGIDLHWLPHAHGSLEVAKICKLLHPHIPIIFGGFSSTYFYEELMGRAEVDFVIRGDSTEEPLRRLMEVLCGRRPRSELHAIPNLVWRDDGGNLVVNPLRHVPDRLDHYTDNYGRMIRTALRYGDIQGMMPIHDWWSYPITAVMTCRGCLYDCSFCGGSRSGLKRFANRSAPAFRSPERIVEDFRNISRFTSAPIFVVGDLRQGGEAYATRVLEGLEDLGIQNHVVLELFTKASAHYFRRVGKALPHFNLEMSPESHDLEVRKASGKLYTNEQLEETIAAAMDAGCEKFDIFFMIGLPNQTYDSVMKTVDYCEALLERFGTRLVPFISPLAPFIDPGSPIYEDPETFGYRLFFKCLEDFRTALLHPHWKYALSYETRWMTRDQIVEATYEAAFRLNRIKGRFGLVESFRCREVEERILLAKELTRRIDEIMALPERERAHALEEMKEEISRVNADTLCEAHEIKWPLLRRNFHFLRIFLQLVKGGLR